MKSTIRGIGLVLAGVLSSPSLRAQVPVTTAGRITGRVIEAETGRPILRAEVTLGDATHRSLTDLDGRFFLQNVPPGTCTVDVRQIGFTAKRATMACPVEIPPRIPPA